MQKLKDRVWSSNKQAGIDASTSTLHLMKGLDRRCSAWLSFASAVSAMRARETRTAAHRVLMKDAGSNPLSELLRACPVVCGLVEMALWRSPPRGGEAAPARPAGLGFVACCAQHALVWFERRRALLLYLSRGFPGI